MSNKKFLAGTACFVVALTLWQWGTQTVAPNEGEVSVNVSSRHAWKSFFSKFENTNASADESVPTIQSPESKSMHQMYEDYKKCLEAPEPCEGYNNASASAYQEDVRRQMVQSLTAYYQSLKAQPHSLTSDDETLARDLVTDATPDVQIIGLQIFDMSAPSETNLEAIAEVLKSAFDDGVAASAGDSLLRYKDDKRYSDMITKSFLAQIGLGVNDQAALSAIEKLPPFLNSANIADFRRLRDELKSMSEKERLQTRRFKALEAALAQYKD